MKVLFAASEAVPFAATGGLADVAGSLPKALKNERTDCRVVIPLYSEISAEYRSKMKYVTNFEVPVAWRSQYCGVFEAEFNGVGYYFLDNEYYFKRSGFYGHFDDAERFTFFSRAVLEMLKHIEFKPDILHANDWHTALIPAFLKTIYSGADGYEKIKSVFTVHSVQYQGIYGGELLTEIVGAPERSRGAYEFNGDLNFMKAALVCADAVTTVSPTYAEELRQPYFGYGLNSVFDEISPKLTGILNGIDTVSYNPQTDKNIFRKYGLSTLEKKAENRRALQKMLGLPEDDDAFIIAMVSRLVEAKGIDLVRFAMDEILSHHAQFILLGKGDWKYENYFQELARRFPGKLSVNIGFLNDLARKIYAGADAFLMPSRTEPCGLSQMVAMRYGTVPIVHEIGGLKDSVNDCGTSEGKGFTFQSFNAGDMLGAVNRAEGAFRQKDVWRAIMERDMSADFSWKASAKAYHAIYSSLLEE